MNILYRTIIDETFKGDTYMPEINYKYFRVIDVTEGVVDEKIFIRIAFSSMNGKN